MTASWDWSSIPYFVGMFWTKRDTNWASIATVMKMLRYINLDFYHKSMYHVTPFASYRLCLPWIMTLWSSKLHRMPSNNDLSTTPSLNSDQPCASYQPGNSWHSFRQRTRSGLSAAADFACLRPCWYLIISFTTPASFYLPSRGTSFSFDCRSDSQNQGYSIQRSVLFAHCSCRLCSDLDRNYSLSAAWTGTGKPE